MIKEPRKAGLGQAGRAEFLQAPGPGASGVRTARARSAQPPAAARSARACAGRPVSFAASRAFYREALGPPTVEGELVEWGDFGILEADEEHPLTHRLHIAFGVEDRDAVDSWWNRLTKAGYRSDGEPGPRPQYSDSYYCAFIIDPDGNSVEAVHHATSQAGEIDHLWMRTRDLAATKRRACALRRGKADLDLAVVDAHLVERA